MKTVTVRPRKSVGTYETFVKRYEPINPPSGEIMWEWKEFPDSTHHHQVWTILDCDGKLYVVPGYHIVNRLGNMLTKHAWSDIEEMNPGYLW